jgi:hypothetical protein
VVVAEPPSEPRRKSGMSAACALATAPNVTAAASTIPRIASLPSYLKYGMIIAR